MTKAFWTLFKREVAALMTSPMAYVIWTSLLLINGLAFTFCVEVMGKSGTQDMNIMEFFFQNFYFWIVLLVLTPILTMRLFAEEYRSGTIENLLTAPVSDWDIILSKFFAVWGFFMFLWIQTLLYLWIYQSVTYYEQDVHFAPLILFYFLLSLVGAFYLAIGLFTSSLTNNQTIAAIGSFLITLVLFLASFIPFVTENYQQGSAASYISIIQHIRTFSAGFMDTRPVVFYVTGTLVFLVLTEHILVSRRLKG